MVLYKWSPNQLNSKYLETGKVKTRGSDIGICFVRSLKAGVCAFAKPMPKKKTTTQII